jgi:D-tagatose-1,6-bisphosphate aldolase subunit GatZ/KbaZ
MRTVESSPNSPALLYVVGTEVPAPGGESTQENSISVTAAQHVEATLHIFKQAFAKRKLEDAWDRVIGLVVRSRVGRKQCLRL